MNALSTAPLDESCIPYGHPAVYSARLDIELGRAQHSSHFTLLPIDSQIVSLDSQINPK
jgi:hypothetical protein